MGKIDNDEQQAMVVGNPLEEIPGAPHGQKRKKDGHKNGKVNSKVNGTAVNPNDHVDPTKQLTPSSDKQIKSIEITPKGKVKIKIMELIIRPLEQGQEDNKKAKRVFTLDTPDDPPHPDFVAAMKSLRRPALELCEIEVDRSKLTDYTVSKIQINGDMTLHQSRAQLTIAKRVNRTDKVIKIGPSSEYTMYGQSDYDGAEALTKAIEDAIKEAWLFINGKSEIPAQLPLFQVR